MQGAREQMSICSRITRPPGARSLPLNLRNVGMVPLAALELVYTEFDGAWRGMLSAPGPLNLLRVAAFRSLTGEKRTWCGQRHSVADDP